MTENENTETQSQSVYITGGATSLGRQLTRALVTAGHSVAVLVQTAADAIYIREDGGLPVYGDATNTVIMRDNIQLADANTVIHLAPVQFNIPPIETTDWKAAAKTLLAETEALVAAIKDREDIRLVYVGSTAVYADATEAVTEDATLREHGDSVFLDALLDAEQTASAAGAVLIRAGYTFSSEAGGTLTFLQERLRRSITPAYFGKATAATNWVHVHDLVAAVLAVAMTAEAGTVYNVVSDTPLSVHDFVALLGEKIGLTLPAALPLAVARGMRGAEAIRLLNVSVPASNTKAKTELGWEPKFPDVNAALEDVLLTWRAQQA